jgi:ketosteroid isomerase-like protein
MAGSDLELIREGFERLASEGYEAMTPMIHPEFEMETPANLAAEPQRYEGVDGFRRWWSSFLEVMDTVTLEASAFHELDPGRIAVEAEIHAVGGASGIETTQGVVLIITVKDGKMAHIGFAPTLEEAMPSGRP